MVGLNHSSQWEDTKRPHQESCYNASTPLSCDIFPQIVNSIFCTDISVNCMQNTEKQTKVLYILFKENKKIFSLVNSLSFFYNHWDAEISRVVCRLTDGFMFGWGFLYCSGPQNRRWFKNISKLVPRGKRVNKISCVYISGTLRLSYASCIVSIYSIQVYHVVLQKIYHNNMARVPEIKTAKCITHLIITWRNKWVCKIGNVLALAHIKWNAIVRHFARLPLCYKGKEML